MPLESDNSSRYVPLWRRDSSSTFAGLCILRCLQLARPLLLTTDAWPATSSYTLATPQPQWRASLPRQRSSHGSEYHVAPGLRTHTITQAHPFTNSTTSFPCRSSSRLEKMPGAAQLVALALGLRGAFGRDSQMLLTTASSQTPLASPMVRPWLPLPPAP